MKRRVFKEDVAEKLWTGHSVDNDTGADLIAQLDLPFNDDKGAGCRNGEPLSGFTDDVDGLAPYRRPADAGFCMSPWSQACHDLGTAYPLQCTAQLRLENDNHGQNTHFKHPVQQPDGGAHLKHDHNQINTGHKQNTLNQLTGSGFPDDADAFVNNIRNQGDIQRVHNDMIVTGCQLNLLPQLNKILDHTRPYLGKYLHFYNHAFPKSCPGRRIFPGLCSKPIGPQAG